MKPIRWLSLRLFRRGILAGQTYDTSRPVQPTTLVCLDGSICKLPGAPGIKDGSPRDWCAARLAARAWNWGETRRRWRTMQDSRVCAPCSEREGRRATGMMPPHPDCEAENGECRCVVEEGGERWIVKAIWFGRW